ncbi:hypothetical protein GCM10025734_44380 [Kitasatospora paranensis]|uniref:hypothetical protein n=1 Tax=Kitasatospora paranensis TaxID=258053 RepID=UPI0031EDCE7F
MSCPPDGRDRSAPASVPDPGAAVGNPPEWPAAGPAQSAQASSSEGPAGLPGDGADGADDVAASAPAADGPSTADPSVVPAEPAVDHPAAQGAVQPARPTPAKVHGRLGRSAPAAVPALPGPVAQAPDQAGQAAPDTSADGPAEQPAPDATATADPQAATELAAPLRWSDASTRQLPLGAGLTLIGSGLALVGYRMRRG